MGFDVETRIRNVTAVLGPTNTGKTHLAIERMLGHETGMIGLPLRLLAREVYDRIVARIGPDKVALVTGEEKIRPENARFWVSTVEAMPREIDVDFLAIDEIQLAADPERGHVFTDRLLHARGKLETLLLGAQTMRDCISDLVPGANFITRPRLSKLSYTGQKKITRLPSRTAIVAFSASEVYAIAELIRRQQGGAAVVMGALSPRTRNAQVALYQSGDVDYLVATDAIGMGLNLDVNHVSFAAIRKFDGHAHRLLTPAELAQIAGRAGRHLNDGTFGVTGDVEPFEHDVIERLETHTFDPIKVLQWRARSLEFGSVNALRESLKQMPREQRLVRARMADDVEALENVSADSEILDLARGPAAVGTLWDVCQIPDYRKISTQNHSELVSTVYKFLMTGDQRIPEDWFAKQVEFSDRTDGDIDTLATRIAHIRTWTFVSNRANWLRDPAHWQGRTREIEDALSDALHEQLTQRFVDRRTSALMKGLRAKEEMSADIGDDGAIHVESHYVGRLKGFRFIPDTQPAEGIHGKAARNAAAQVLVKELAMRVRRVASAKNDAFKLQRNGRVMWRDQEIAQLEPGEDGLKPQITVIADEHLPAADRDKVQERLQQWLTESVAERLQPLAEIGKAEDIAGLAKGIAFQLREGFGSLKRDSVAEEIKSLDQAARSQLRKYGVRFGAFNIYFPPLLKPAAADLTLSLWALKHARTHNLDVDALPDAPRAGLTSVAANPQIPDAFYRACGYHVCGPRAVRMDILERLADLIRPLIAWRQPQGQAAGQTATPPRGSTGDGGFLVIPEMLSILGCSADELSLVLKTLGFRVERRIKRVAAPATVATPDAAMDAAASAGVEAVSAPDASATPADGAADASAGATATEAAGAPQPTAEAATTVPEAAQSSAAEIAVAAPRDAIVETPADVPVETTFGTPAETPVEAAAAAGPETGDGAAATPPTTSAPAEPEMEDVWRPRRHRREAAPGDERRQGQGRRPHRGGQNQRAGDRHDQRPHQRQGPRGSDTPAHAAVAADGSTPAASTDIAAGEGASPGRTERQGDRRSDRGGQRHRHGGRGPDHRSGQDKSAPQAGQQGQQDGQPPAAAAVPGQNQSAAGAPQQAGQGRPWQGRPNQGKPGQGGPHQGKPGGPGGRDSRDGGRGQHQRRDDRGERGGDRGDRGPRTFQAGPKPQGKQQRQTVDPDSPFAKLNALKLELEKRAQEQSSS